MDAMIAPRLHAAQFFDSIERVVSCRGGDTIETALDFIFVIVDGDVEGIKGPKKAIGGADGGGDLFDRRGIQGFARSRGRETIQGSELVAHDQTTLRIGAKIDPRTLLFRGNRVKQFDFEIL